MTEKLTYDPTPADAPEFTEEEQDSLRVADELGEKENELLAGKYQNAEELEEAYLNLQKKLGSQNEDDEVEDNEDKEFADEDEPKIEKMQYKNGGLINIDKINVKI